MTQVSLHGADFWNLSSVFISDDALTPTALQRESDLGASILEPSELCKKSPLKEFLPKELEGHQPAGAEDKHEDEDGHNLSASWLLSFVSQLSNWVINHAAPGALVPAEEAEEESDNHGTDTQEPDGTGEEEALEYWEEWEWILSETEKFAIRRSAEDAVRIRSELDGLRKNAHMLRMRPYFLKVARKALDEKGFSIADREKLARTVLDAPKRSKIISDIVNSYADQWLRHIELNFLDEFGETKWKTFTDSYRESLYHKGVVGGIKELGWQASHGKGDEGLTDITLAEIGWAMWKTLSSSLRWALARELDAEENDALAEVVGHCTDSIIGLWFSTVTNSELGAAREGMLPAKWAEEDERERKRIEEIKRQGVSARYEYKPVKIRPGDRKKLRDLKAFLEMHLQLRTAK